MGNGTDQSGPRRRPPVVIGIVAAATLVAAGVATAWFVAGDDNTPKAAAPTTSTTTTTAPPTTTSLPPIAVDPTVTDVATAEVPMVNVLAEPPADATLDPRATLAGTTLTTLTAAYSAERPDAPAIPTIESPVQGRRRTDTGWEFDSPTPFGNPLTFVVTEDHGAWLRVMMPVRPNGTQGWIRAADVTRTTVTTHIDIDLSDRRLTAWDGTRQIADTKVVVGAEDRPTPQGRLYVTDDEEKYRGSAYGPWVLPLSGYSQQLDEFSGGVPVIAMHGTNNPSLIGSAASNGCIRMPDDVIELLHAQIPFGTPVDIRD